MSSVVRLIPSQSQINTGCIDLFKDAFFLSKMLIQAKFRTENPGDKPITVDLARDQLAYALKGFELAFRILGCFHGVVVSRPHIHAGYVIAIPLNQPPKRSHTGLDGK